MTLGWLARSLRRMKVATLAIAGGDLNARVPESGPREIAQVGAGLNKMTQRLIQRSIDINAVLARDLEASKAEASASSAALIASEARFRAMVQNAPDMVSIMDAQGTPMYASPSVERVLGYAADQWAVLNVFSLIHPDDREDTGRLLAHG